jgi:tetraacyldisaccharide 4'-kinase
VASRLETYSLSLIGDPGRPGLTADLARSFLSGCAGLYDAGLEFYLQAELLGLRRRTHLPLPVLSIGNLVVGGTGKTPMTQWLCRCLQSDGMRVAVLSRGHGGTGDGVRVVSTGETEIFATAAEAGDEPILLAKTLSGIPLLTGKDRRLSGREALRRFALDALVLDDGFQYWQLARDLDVVLLDARRPFDNGYPLPRGLLREPKRHLARAGIVVVTRSEDLTALARVALKTQITALVPSAPVFFARHQASGLVAAEDLAALPLPVSWLSGKRIVALSGIAQPASFVSSLRHAGADIAEHLVYPDHTVYTEADARRATQAVRVTGAEALLMTEKDAVKWPVAGGVGAIYALRIEMQIEDGAHFMETVRTRLFGGRRG